MGGLISRFLSATKKALFVDIKSDPGAGANVTSKLAQPAGDDAVPLDGDYLAILSIKKSGGYVVVGVIDPNNEKKAEAGEKRIYSRKPNGETAVEFWLKNDGSAILINENGSYELSADGSHNTQNANGSYSLAANGIFNVNGVTIDTDGNIVTSAKVTASEGEITTLESVDLTTVTAEIGDIDFGGHKHAAGGYFVVVFGVTIPVQNISDVPQ